MSTQDQNSQSQQLVVKDFPNSALTQHILDAAAKSPEFAGRLASDPSETFLAAGMTLSSVGGLRTDFNDYFRKEGAQILTQIQAAHASNKTTSLVEIEAQVEASSVKCKACKVGAFGVAGALVAVGVAALASLTEAGPVVISVASFLGISRGDALSFIKSIAPKIESGAETVAEALCQKLGAC